MKHALTTPKENQRLLVIAGYFTEVQDFVSQIEVTLRSRLRYSVIEPTQVDDQESEDEEIEEVRATVHISIVDGTELDQVKKLLESETFKWVHIVDEGEVLSNDNGDSLPMA